ncbi:MAG: ribonuclease P protein component [Phycisphaerales bacterium]|nr:ribonuclease P protein component [Phycisphaerales bacterium]
MQYRNPPQFRLRSKEAISRVFESGRRARDRSLLVLAACNDLPERPARMAVTVAKRLGSAPQRNRIKRVVREVLRYQRPELKSGIDVVVLPQRADLTLEQVRASFLKLTTKLSVRRESCDGDDR